MQPWDADADRALSARAMIERVRPLMAAMGITRLADLTGLDRIGVPVFAAVRPNARSVATSQGKGLAQDAARVGALMEAVESWHAVDQQDGPRPAPHRAQQVADRRRRQNGAVEPRPGLDGADRRAGEQDDAHRPARAAKALAPGR